MKKYKPEEREIIWRKKIRVESGRIHFAFMRLCSKFKVQIAWVTKTGHYTDKNISIYLEYCSKLPRILRKLASVVERYSEK